MSNVITGFIVIAVLLIGAGVMVQGAIKWMTQTSDAWSERESRSSEIVRTSISVISTDKTSSPYVDEAIVRAAGRIDEGRIADAGDRGALKDAATDYGFDGLATDVVFDV